MTHSGNLHIWSRNSGLKDWSGNCTGNMVQAQNDGHQIQPSDKCSV